MSMNQSQQQDGNSGHTQQPPRDPDQKSPNRPGQEPEHEPDNADAQRQSDDQQAPRPGNE